MALQKNPERKTWSGKNTGIGFCLKRNLPCWSGKWMKQMKVSAIKRRFENEAMEETDQNQWIASEEIYDVMEDSLIRIKDIYTQMEAFQNRLVKESAGGKHGSEV